MRYEYNPNEALWDQAYEMAYQRASEEKDLDVDYDYELIESLAEEYYDYLTNQRG